MKCLQCGAEEVVRNLRVVDRGENNVRRDLTIEVESKPSALFFKGIKAAVIRANVCPKCGFVMMSVSKGDAKMLKRTKTSF